ncbi:MAG: acyl-CoA dehydrogenase family protein, partial [Minwuiales bacterium]|nr:acyl-CoA dehydrogenase family protein [Minwuiales bacterium]
MTVQSHPPEPLAAARALAPTIRARADEIEAGRRLPADLARQMAEAGLFRLLVPASLGGAEADPATLLNVIEAVAEADGAAGWCVMIGATSGLTAAYLPETAAREIYGADPAAITGGVFAPMGKAVAVDGGYQVSGQWQWASGSQNCAWLMGGSVILDDGKPRLLENGMPDSRMMLFPADQVEIIDTWQAAGLCGTGSHDMAVADRFVPAERSVSLITDRPRANGPLYTFPVFGLLAMGIAAVTLGIARRSISELIELAQAKTPTLSRSKLAKRSRVQSDLAEAEAMLRSARAFLFEATAAAWDSASGAGEIPLE